jgi:hypothetical protein
MTLSDNDVVRMLQKGDFAYVLRMKEEGKSTLDILNEVVEYDPEDSYIQNTSYALYLYYEWFRTGKRPPEITKNTHHYIAGRGGIVEIDVNTAQVLSLRRLIEFLDGNDEFEKWMMTKK